jgi:hypothetical protein
LRIKLICSGSTTLDAAFPSSRYGFGITVIFNLIFDLAGGDIDDQLAELDRVAGSLETLGRHPAIMARRETIANPACGLLH